MRDATQAVAAAPPSVLEPAARAALVVAHPGHELRVHGWVERVRPVVYVLTDGSGGFDLPRVDASRAVLADAGAAAGGVFGRLTDRDLYAAVLDGDHALFERIALDLADALVAADVDHVVGDAAEGYNPGHDVCRLVTDCAVALTGRPIARWDFTLVGRPDGPAGPGEAARLTLAPAAAARKLAIAESYPDLAGEVDHALRTFGVEAFATECLRRLETDGAWTPEGDAPCFYEQFGEYQVAAGRYARVLRHGEHMRPLAAALADLAARSQRVPRARATSARRAR
jgi:hypothetical protein